eukprot:scaffold1044_cov266-Pinguiococcus_pyrenoidosus.AAC.3
MGASQLDEHPAYPPRVIWCSPPPKFVGSESRGEIPVSLSRKRIHSGLLKRPIRPAPVHNA